MAKAAKKNKKTKNSNPNSDTIDLKTNSVPNRQIDPNRFPDSINNKK